MIKDLVKWIVIIKEYNRSKILDYFKWSQKYRLRFKKNKISYYFVKI